MDAYEFAASRLSSDANAAIASFWQRFALIAEPLADTFDGNRKDFDVVSETQAALGALDWHDWEYGPGVDGGHRLCISAGWSAERRSMARAIALAAPRLPRWTFSDVRDANAPEDVLQFAANRSAMAPCIEGFRLIEAEHNLIDVEVVPMPGADAKDAADQGACAITVLLGETEERTWIGDIRPGAPGHSLQPGEARNTFYELKAAILERLPGTPWVSINPEDDGVKWATLSRNLPDEVSPLWRNDMYVGVSPFMDRLTAVTQCSNFSSARYSRFGETFAYLKLDGTVDGALGRLEDRGELEDMISETLKQQGMGSAIGGGTGKWFSYVELAFTHVGDGVNALQQALQGANIGRGTWILFDEAGLDRFHIPIWPDAPAPPLPRT